MVRSMSIVAVVLLSAGAAFGQGVVVENHYVADIPSWSPSIPFGWTEIPGSSKTVTLPAGTATIQWTFSGQATGGEVFVRPVVGTLAPNEGLSSGLFTIHAGSWVTATAGGTMPVKLEMRADSGVIVNVSRGLTWTVTVHPDAGAVPAVSGVGLVIMGALVLAVGAMIVRRRKAAVA